MDADTLRFGSAPHTQGTGLRLRLSDFLRRFSPAHAGNGTSRPCSRRSRTVQPRTRRERSTACKRDLVVDGSAPHTQGTARRGDRGHRQPRFSPAHAGNGAQVHGISDISTVQPRTRRERADRLDSAAGVTGSAPHTQGTGRQISRHLNTARFSPAHAGNGPAPVVVVSAITVQPRTRRERAILPNNCACGRGSAPTDRFSPAHAGNGCPSLGPGPGHTVQPRTRRERRPSGRRTTASSGSAPHTQGTGVVPNDKL